MLNSFIISIQVQQNLNLISIIQVATNVQFFYVQVIVPYSSQIKSSRVSFMGLFKLVKFKNNKNASPFNYRTGQKSKLV